MIDFDSRERTAVERGRGNDDDGGDSSEVGLEEREEEDEEGMRERLRWCGYILELKKDFREF